jgi:type I restriction enzyme, S subunit
MKFEIKKIGSIIEEVNLKNLNLTYKNLLGLNANKEFMPSVANQEGLDLTKYRVITQKNFAINLMQVGRDELLRVALYHDKKNSIISSAYKIFKVINEEEVIPEFLMMNFQKKEFDRFCWFISDSNIRSALEWDRFCNIEIKVPNYTDQKNLVIIYKSILEKKEKAKKNILKLKKILNNFFLSTKGLKNQLGKFISESVERNTGNLSKNYLGISIKKKFIKSRLDQETFSSIDKHKVIKKDYFAFITTTSRNGEKISIAMLEDELAIVSATYVVFNINDTNKLREKYLMLYFKENEFDRYARYHSWGSARETFGWDDMKKVRLHLPSVEKQDSIIELGNIVSSYEELIKKYDTMIKKICPIFLKGIN